MGSLMGLGLETSPTHHPPNLGLQSSLTSTITQLAVRDCIFVHQDCSAKINDQTQVTIICFEI